MANDEKKDKSLFDYTFNKKTLKRAANDLAKQGIENNSTLYTTFQEKQLKFIVDPEGEHLAKIYENNASQRMKSKKLYRPLTRVLKKLNYASKATKGLGIYNDYSKYGLGGTIAIQGIPLTVSALTKAVPLVGYVTDPLMDIYKDKTREFIDNDAQEIYEAFKGLSKQLNIAREREFKKLKKILNPMRRLPKPSKANLSAGARAYMGSYLTQDTTPLVHYPVINMPAATASGGGGSFWMDMLGSVAPMILGAVAGPVGAAIGSVAGRITSSLGNSSSSGGSGGGTYQLGIGGYHDNSGKLYKYSYHSGGKVPGRKEVMALLRGGETVRTEGQEAALQEDLQRKQEPVVPIGQQNNKQAEKNNTISNNFTKQDEQYIISLIADAYRRNRFGFRKVMS